MGRDLRAAGHHVVAIDGSPALAAAAATHADGLPAMAADAARLPVRDGAADLVVAFMSLQDIDDLDGAVAEAARVLRGGGRLCLAVVHPLNSAGQFDGARDDATAPFVIAGSYLDAFDYVDEVERRGLAMPFHSIDTVREVTLDDVEDRWARIPMFLHVRAVRPS